MARTNLVDTIYSLFPASVFSSLPPSFYVTFWSLSLYDIHVPRQRYEEEIKLLQDQLSQSDDKDPQQVTLLNRYFLFIY